MMFTMHLVLLCQFFMLVSGYKMYQDSVPNGAKVPHPCKPNYIWDGVGHKNEQGGGSRNPFGVDFAANGYKWDATLCQKDSDGDGKTNGQELGDPDCTWTSGGVPSQTTGLTHPGVCEPLTSSTCKAVNDWEFCEATSFNCSITSDAGVSNMTFAMPKTEVPATETNYYCQLFNLPSDQDYHIIAHEPALDNQYVIHHMLLFGCSIEVDMSTSNFKTPQPCGMNNGGSCGDIIAGWTLGDTGYCNTGPAGVRIGNSTYKQALLQVHWNNPSKQTGYTDGSGIILHYTPTLRQYDMATITVGQMGLRIPPGQAAYTQTATCTSACTQAALTTDINIASVGLHMHYLGKGGSLALYRGGSKISDLAVQDSYSYDTPLDYVQSPVQVMKAGDELKVSCTFRSTTQNSVTYYGDSTQAEMCFAFVTYYPKVDFPRCVSFGETCICNLNTNSSLKIGNCDISVGSTGTAMQNMAALTSVCDTTGATCNPMCKRALTSGLPCITGDAKLLTEFTLSRSGTSGQQIINALRSCDKELYASSASGLICSLWITILGLLSLRFN